MPTIEQLEAQAAGMGLSLTEQYLDRDLGHYDARTRTITLHDRLNNRQRLCTLQHELIHAEHHRDGLMILGKAKEESLTRRQTAKRLITMSDYATAEEFDAALLAVLKENAIDIVVLAGFLSILGKSVIAAYPERILNVHPSLIPSFCGEGMYGLKVHEAALAKGVKVTGATVHFVNEVCDGGRIIAQKAVEVAEGDTPETLQRRVMEQAEWKLLPAALAKVCAAYDKG